MADYWYINADYCYCVQDGKLHKSHLGSVTDVGKEEDGWHPVVKGTGFCSPIGLRLKGRILWDESDVLELEEEPFCERISKQGWCYGYKLPVRHVFDVMLGYMSGLIETGKGVWSWQDGIAISTYQGIVKVLPSCPIEEGMLRDFQQYMAKLAVIGVLPDIRRDDKKQSYY